MTYAEINTIRISPHLINSARNSVYFTPQNDPKSIIKEFRSINDSDLINHKNSKLLKVIYDLKAFGFLGYNSEKIYLSDLGKTAKTDPDSFVRNLIANALKTEKIRIAFEEYKESKNEYAVFCKKIESILTNINSEIYKKKTQKVLFNWGEFISTQNIV